MKKYEIINWEKIIIRRLKEIPTLWTEMIEYLKWELIVNPKAQKKYNKREVKAYNDWIKTAISIIGSVPTRLVDK